LKCSGLDNDADSSIMLIPFDLPSFIELICFIHTCICWSFWSSYIFVLKITQLWNQNIFKMVFH